MHVISRRPFLEAANRFPNSHVAIEDCFRVLKNGIFETPESLCQVFPSLDNFRYRDRWWIINISGNHLRLMAFIEFKHNRIYVRHIVTHAEYNKLTNRYRKESKR